VVLEAEMTPKKKTVIEGSMVSGKKMPFAVKPAASQEDGLDVASLPETWTVQISDFRKKGDADAVIKTLKKVSAATMQGKQAFTVPAKKKGRKTTYQVVIKGYSKLDAQRSCERVSATGMACAVIPPNG
jgi:hypothetical protein